MRIEPPDDGSRWGVLHVKPLRERSVASRLEQRGVRPYVPLYRRRAPRTERPAILAPLFPGYVFARLDGEDSAYRAMWTPGVLRLLGDGHRPYLVPPELMRELVARERAKGYVVLRKSFAADAPVRIARGLFAGLEGVFQKETSDGERVRILLRHLGHRAVVELPSEDVEAAAPDERPR